MNQYTLYFTYEGTVLQLPQNPETIPVDLPGDNQEYNVLGIGPITIPRTPKQKKVKISSFFPADYSIPPETYIKFFQDAMYEQRIVVYTPVRFTEKGEAFNGGDDGFQCLVSDFSTEERGGETGDFYYTLNIVEYRDYSPKIVEVRPVQSGYAVSAVATRNSSGIQVGDVVTASGPAKLYYTEETPTATVSDAKAIVTRKDDGILTLKPIDDIARFNLIDDTERKQVPLKKNTIYDWDNVTENSLLSQTFQIAADEGAVKALKQTPNPTTGEYVTYSITDEMKIGLNILDNLVGKQTKNKAKQK